MKKGISLVLILILTLSLLPFASATTLEGPLEMRFLYHPLIEQMAKEAIDYNENRILQAHEANSGIALQLTPALVDGVQEKQKQAMILSSGQVPDMMLVDRADYFKYAFDGVLLPTDSYLPNMPHYNALVPDISRDSCRVDGVLYGFPGSHEEMDMFGGGGIVVRKDIYDQLGLESAPTTLDEYYDMYMLVKEKTGMIPLVHKDFSMFKASFGILSTTKEVDGKLVYTWTQPEAKAYLEYMNKLYADGLLDPEYLTSNTAALQEKFLTGRAFSANLGWASPCVTINGVLTKIEGSELAYLPIPTSPDGKPAEVTRNFPVQRFNVIPANSKNPDLAAKFIEYMSTPEAKMIQNYGIEGVDYQMVDGKVQQTLAEQNNVGWKIAFEYIPTPDSFKVRLVAKGFDWAFLQLQDAQKTCTPISDETVFMAPSIDYLKLEQQLAIKAYADEQFDKFIVGERAIGEWDAFLGELEERGLSRLESKLNEWRDSLRK